MSMAQHVYWFIYWSSFKIHLETKQWQLQNRFAVRLLKVIVLSFFSIFLTLRFFYSTQSLNSSLFSKQGKLRVMTNLVSLKVLKYISYLRSIYFSNEFFYLLRKSIAFPCFILQLIIYFYFQQFFEVFRNKKINA